VSKGPTVEITKLLVANRGEIAVRVLRACRAAGISSVVVVSEADRSSVAAQLADEVVEIGPAPATESYLLGDRILDVAVETACQAIHPGYGFLAENAGFARSCAERGVVFIGPSPEVIESMGVKTRARETMIAAGVPVVPGATLDLQAGDSSWLKTAEEVGYPVLVKAASGGGGKGMRSVTEESKLGAAIRASQREAASAFGDATVYLERQLLRPRHIEVQIFADDHGNAVHIGERDCSIQRRHQKVVEEALAPGLSDSMRSKMRESAVAAAKAVAYSGAGTVEMLLDESGEFYFLEMNTRLQVEHPVSELVSGLDFVLEQIRVAEGQPLSFRQEDIHFSGHAMEARVYAENPQQNFMPQTGPVLVFEAPTGPGIRVETGVQSGDEVTLHYDPMIAKVCAFGATREESRRRLCAALRETVLLGVTTNLSYLIAILESSAFVDGVPHTSFLEDNLSGWSDPGSDELLPWGTAAWLLGSTSDRGASGSESTSPSSPLWSQLPPLRLVEEASWKRS
jgi:acetyl-CoA carboxylase biotin carboxylase subunit